MTTVFVLAQRYGRDLCTALQEHGLTAELVRQPASAAAAFARSTASIALIDARGAAAAAMLAAHEMAGLVEARRGAMLVLIGRGDTGGVTAAYASGATQVLVSPFTARELADAIGFAGRLVGRLAVAAGERQADHDPRPHRDLLTGLATAHHALTWLQGMVGGEGEPAAGVLLIGVGRFAAINAAHGQPAADALLQAVAERLARVVEDGPGGGGRLAARMAGAEFAVILPAPVILGDAMVLARGIVAAFEQPFASNGRIVHLAVRIGIAAAAGAGGEGAAERLFRHATAALAAARTGAPGAIEVYSADAGAADPLARLADLESDLRRAIADDAFEIVYQPQVAIADGRIAGVEALVRWRHPEFGPLPAETLLEVAGTAEFGTELGDYIRSKALHEACRWPATLGGLQLSVNVTGSDLRSPEFQSTLEAALQASGFPPARLVVEITESDLIENLDAAAVTLGALRAAGIGVALDDFGTGYSSLAYLKALPLDALKLDKRLTRDLAGGPRDRIVVRVVAALARALGIRVVAEGVETEADLAHVTAARCDWYQGFLCSPAMPAEAVANFVERWNATAGPSPGSSST